MDFVSKWVGTLLGPGPDARLFALLTISLVTSAGFYFFSIAILSGAMPTSPSVMHMAMMAVLVALIAYFSARVRSASAVALLGVLLCAGVGLSFATEVGYGIHFVGRAFPLADPMLARFDHGLGFDSRALLHWVDRHSDIAGWLKESYLGCGNQTLLALIVMIATRQNERLLMFTAANFLSLFIVHLFAIVMPAVGAYSFYRFTAADHPHIALPTLKTAAHVFALRSASELVIPGKDLQGLVTFPSYHMVSACLFAWLFWKTRWLRWPALLFNAGVAVSALVDGCHYLADVIAGALLAAGSLWLVEQFAREMARAAIFGSGHRQGAGIGGVLKPA